MAYEGVNIVNAITGFYMEKITLCKFRNINKFLIDTLVKGTIYCARPILLNDPFDCQVDIRKAVDHAITSLSGKKKQNLIKLSKPNGLFDAIQKSIKNVGVCSFSLVLEDPLLWSHYANGHKGLCLTYEFPSQFFFGPGGVIILRVAYGENLLTEWLMEKAPEKAKINAKKFSNELVEKILSIKGKGWEYEQEARIICSQERAIPIAKDYLKQVCFGMNADESDISLIKQLIDNAGYAVEYYQMERTEKDFGIKAVKI
jgi:hypothetical protein